MNIAIEPLATPEAFSACERLQQDIFAGNDRQILPGYLLVTLTRAGGTALGAYDTEVAPPRLCGCLIDLAAYQHGNLARSTLLHAVAKAVRNRGIGYRLRMVERKRCQREHVELVTWLTDPLRSTEAHFAVNKLGAIATSYERNVFGELSDPANRGLATDRLTIEWWINSPRVCEVIDKGKLPHHYLFGLERMEVVTKTRLTNSGQRRLLNAETNPRSAVILFEIPADLDRLREHDLDLARDWRIKTRDAFETLFANRYILSGFVHEAGRSFHLFEREKKASLLRRTG